ncbi:protein of unknown function DUF1499 [Solidesulfovibrio fructosivorans JJ]]|uniref:DUF1499 domain-containing protein n=1 Tax=Solidesulfovibrio fructosivorans JJ] TaxID=596151 RepID=E1K299_SOLFR|nr:DUF1499 domain-containing protein [Solidesulfovibrio fructosivorans]EFL49254.1 protein of unknown function DUF1499 [Solidesulfovibrio fructosivorans JJ]]
METLRHVVSFFEAVGQVAAVVLLAAGLVLVCGLAWLGRASRRMGPLVSPAEGPLRADGKKPNWVATTASPRDPLHFVAPRPCAENPIPALAAYLEKNGYAVRVATGRYLHATQSSFRFGFVDDVEFLHDPQAGLLHARSASRVGYSDLGVNRRRLETIFRETGL